MLRRSMVKFVGIGLPVALLAFVGLNTTTFAQEKKADDKPKMEEKKGGDKDIVETATASPNHKTFVKLVTAAGLTDTLKGKGPYTVFGPTDEAFDKIKKDVDEWMKPENKSKLAEILKHHVTDGKHMAADVAKMKTAKMLDGKEAKVTTKDGKTMIDNATVTKADMGCSNGVIHAVDAVLMAEKKADDKKPGGH